MEGENTSLGIQSEEEIEIKVILETNIHKLKNESMPKSLGSR
jgi:hypothetical protein